MTISEALIGHRVVGLDTSLFIYHIENAAPFNVPAGIVLRKMADGDFRGITSVLTLMEIAVRPLQLGLPDIAATYEIVIERLPNLKIVEFDRLIARRAAELRARYRLHTADALQVAACLRLGATAFVTNDKDLRRVQEANIIVLDDFIER